MASPDFKLRCELTGHSQDVRCIQYVQVNGKPSIISVSRDCTARLWQEETIEDRKTYKEILRLQGHEKYINCVTYMRPFGDHAQGIIFTGGLDHVIRAFDAGSGLLLYKCTGHSSLVTCLTVDDSRHMLVSCSADKSVRVWQGAQCVGAPLEKHTMCIWAVLVVGQVTNEAAEASRGSETPSILSASADKSIILWINGQPKRTFEGHTDCVRCLAELDDLFFFSAGNDATIRKWNRRSGECVLVYRSTDFIYSLACMPGNDVFVSGGEDKALRFWNIGKTDCTQSLLLPAQSVWSVAMLSNGDVACGSSDGAIRIFTTARSRQATPDLLEVFDQCVQAFHRIEKIGDAIGGVKVADLPGIEALARPGVRDGQQKMVRVRDKIELHVWSDAQGKWQKFGDVLGEKGDDSKNGTAENGAAGNKKMHEGKYYDYVFDVDIEDGKPTLKLPYNSNEDQWHAAQQFIDKHILPQAYLETVANFITQNAKVLPKPKVPSGSETFVDPFTGAGRYVPGENGSVQNASNATTMADPLTGSGRYVPGSGGSTTSFDPTKLDPKRPRGDNIPLSSYVKFDAYLPTMLNKILENNGSLASNDSKRLSPLHIDALKVFVEHKNAPASDLIIEAIDKLLTWDISILPPCVDLLRLALLSEPVFDHYFGSEAAERCPVLVNSLCAQMVPDAPLGVLVFGCRALANAVAMGATGAFAKEPQSLHLIFQQVARSALFNKPMAQAAATSLLSNIAFSLFGSKEPAHQDMKQQLLCDMLDLLNSSNARMTALDQQPLMSLLQALTTVLWGDEQLILNAAQHQSFKRHVTQLKDLAHDESTKNVARCLEHMLY